MKNKYLFYIGHPAHWHNLNYLAQRLTKRGHSVLLIIRRKDVMNELVKSSNLDLVILENIEKKASITSLFKPILKRYKEMYSIIKNRRPTLLVGTDFILPQLGNLLNIRSIVINEDDLKAVPFFSLLAYPFATKILTPKVCNVGIWKYKQITYDGYQELAYLAPNVFKPNLRIVKKYFSVKKKYFIIRFSSLNAHHDYGKKGISNKLALEIIEILKQYGEIFITSERELSANLEKYRINIDAKDMHHVLNFAETYIGDSQTMAAEAAILGTPSIRFSSFTNKLGYLKELQSKYNLTIGINSNEPDKLIETIKRVVETKNIKPLWNIRSKIMISNKINVQNFFYNFFINYHN